MADNTTLIALLRELGAVTGTDSDGEPIGAEQVLVQEPAERVFFRGYWYPGVYPFAGASAEDLRQLERFRRTIDGYVAMRDGRGRRAFTLPVSRCSDDPDLRALDRLSARAWLDAHGFTSARLRWLALYACRDDYSLGLDEASAWALIFYWAARIRRPGADAQPVLTWPEGNGALVHHLAAVTGARAHTGHLAVDVEQYERGGDVGALHQHLAAAVGGDDRAGSFGAEEGVGCIGEVPAVGGEELAQAGQSLADAVAFGQLIRNNCRCHH